MAKLLMEGRNTVARREKETMVMGTLRGRVICIPTLI
jgi:hypothetical protein